MNHNYLACLPFDSARGGGGGGGWRWLQGQEGGHYTRHPAIYLAFFPGAPESAEQLKHILLDEITGLLSSV